MLERKKNVWDEAKDNETFERRMAAMSEVLPKDEINMVKLYENRENSETDKTDVGKREWQNG